MSHTAALLVSSAPPAPGALQGFEFLDTCHRELAQKLEQLQRWGSEIDHAPLPVELRRVARELLDWFNTTARAHHLDEERLIFPHLLSSRNAELVQVAERLIQDHGWLEADWNEIEPALSAAAEGQCWFDPLVVQHAIQVYTQLYHDHMMLEERFAYPAAWERISEDERERISGDMARRRHLRQKRHT